MTRPALWTPLHDRLHQTLRQRHLVQHHQRLLVAVSGGQDSLCLMQLLLDLQPKWQWALAIAHCNHRWRADSDANADHVQQWASTWAIPYHGSMADPPPVGEAAARRWRYQVLTDLAVQHQYGAVLTGHTLSDRAETLVFNLLRGSGADGLQALTWTRPLKEGIALVRPLLGISRSDTAQFCEYAQLPVWPDATNDDWHYARNRIRQDLFPYLQTHFNPQVEQALAQTAELLRADVDCLEAIAEPLYQQSVAWSETRVCIHRPLLQSAPLALQRRVLRRVLQQIMPVAPTFDPIEKVVALINAPNRTQTDPLPGGAIARVQGDWIVME